MNFFSFRLRSSFSISAKMIGAGKENSRVRKLVARVFRMIMLKSLVKKY